MNIEKEEQFLQYIEGVREDYGNQEIKWKRILKMVILSIIPIISFLNSHLGVLIFSAIMGVLEFLSGYFKCEEKLAALNEIITKINFEYQTYFYDADERYKNDHGFYAFVNNIEKIVFDTELKINNNYNSDAYDNIKIEK